jgi:hypothetical protein
LGASAWAADRFQFSPSKIKPNDGYEIVIDLPDGTQLDYDRRFSTIAFDNLVTDSGAFGTYTVQNGKVTVSPGQNLDEGVHMMRFKPQGAPASEYTKFDVLLVDALDTEDPNLVLTQQTISLPPPPGSYIVYENWKDGQFLGYSRFDYETDPCETGGFTMRMTKTHEACYWNATGPSWLRWCVDHADTPHGRYLVATGGTVYQTYAYGSMAGFATNAINVTYNGNGWQQSGSQGLLGGWPVDEVNNTAPYLFDDDMRIHYSLLPEDDKIPANLSATPQTVVELAYGHYSDTGHDDTFLDTWHDSALEPTMPDSVLRMRYVETGEIMHATWLQDRWSVTEDWDWTPEGLVIRVIHWVWNDPPCWRDGYDCETNATLAVDARMVDYYIPDNQPLNVWLKDMATQDLSRRALLDFPDSYTLYVELADGRPYHGFLEFQFPDGGTTLWRDKDLKPIYVSNGHVTVGPDAYGSVGTLCSQFRVRPYLANSSVNACVAVPDTSLIANAGTAQFSNWAALYFSLIPADLDQDQSVSMADFNLFEPCLTGPNIEQTDPNCRKADLDLDGDVDVRDFAELQRCYSGQGIPADIACAE